MKTKFIFLIFLLIQVCIYGQTIEPGLISSSGTEFTKNNIALSWSLGEINITTINSSDAILTQGFQQTGIYTTATLNPELNYDLSIFPNPSKDFITIKFEDGLNNFKSFHILDINGKICHNGIFTANEQIINIRNFTAGLYFVSIVEGKGIILTNIKILKTNN